MRAYNGQYMCTITRVYSAHVLTTKVVTVRVYLRCIAVRDLVSCSRARRRQTDVNRAARTGQGRSWRATRNCRSRSTSSCPGARSTDLTPAAGSVQAPCIAANVCQNCHRSQLLNYYSIKFERFVIWWKVQNIHVHVHTSLTWLSGPTLGQLVLGCGMGTT